MGSLRVCLLFALFFLFACKEEEEPEDRLSPSEREFQSKLIIALKKMDRRYRRSTKELKKSTTLESSLKVIDEHLGVIHQFNEEMLTLEMDDPELFESQEKNPPDESKTLRASVEQFALVMTKLSFKYKKNKAFVKAYQRVFNNPAAKDAGIKKIYVQLIKAEKNDYINSARQIEEALKDPDHGKSIKLLKNFLSSAKKNKNRRQRLLRKYPDIVENQTKIVASDKAMIQKFASSISNSLQNLVQKVKNEPLGQELSQELENIARELKPLLKH